MPNRAPRRWNPQSSHPGQQTREQVERLHAEAQASAARMCVEPPATLGALLKFHHGLLATCLDCSHEAELDVLAMSLRFGETFTVPELVPYLRCTKPGCGSNRCTVQVTNSSIRQG